MLQQNLTGNTHMLTTLSAPHLLETASESIRGNQLDYPVMVWQ